MFTRLPRSVIVSNSQHMYYIKTTRYNMSIGQYPFVLQHVHMHQHPPVVLWDQEYMNLNREVVGFNAFLVGHNM